MAAAKHNPQAEVTSGATLSLNDAVHKHISRILASGQNFFERLGLEEKTVRALKLLMHCIVSRYSYYTHARNDRLSAHHRVFFINVRRLTALLWEKNIDWWHCHAIQTSANIPKPQRLFQGGVVCMRAALMPRICILRRIRPWNMCFCCCWIHKAFQLLSEAFECLHDDLMQQVMY